MSKRGNTEGTIYQEPSGRWRVEMTLGYVSGRRVRKKLRFETQREAREALTKLRRELDQGIEPGDDRMTMRRFLEKWLTECVEGAMSTLRPNTRVSYASLTRNHLIPGLGHHLMAKLSPVHVQAFLTAKSSEKIKGADDDARLSPRTVRYILILLRRSLRQAMRWGLVARNVATLVDPPRMQRREAQALTMEEATALLASVKANRLRALFTVAVALGLRRGEIVGLRWEHVDLKTGVLRVREQLQRVRHVRNAAKEIVERKGLVVSEPKSDKSRRTLRIPSHLVDELREHKARQTAERLAAGPAWSDTGYAFTTETGAPLDGRNLLRRWQTSLKASGLPAMPFHASRHTAASLLLAQGVPLHVVMEILGHSQIALTANTYAHVMENLHDDAAEKMDAFLRRG